MPGYLDHTCLAGKRLAIVLGLLLICICLAESGWCGNSEVDPQPPPDPWFTGTLLSTRGRTLSPGHVVVQPYVFYTRYGGLYNDNWRLQSATVSRTIIQQTVFIYGLTSRIDIGIAPQWLETSSSRDSIFGFGDLPLQLGFQLVRGDSDSWLPYVLFWVQQVFPTGRHHHLGPSAADLGGTGGGSFGTTLGVSAQKSLRLSGDHVFRYRVNASYGFYSPVTVRGFNTYGLLSDPVVGDGSVDQLCQTMHHRAWRQQLSEMGELNGTGHLLEWWGTSTLDASGEGI